MTPHRLDYLAAGDIEEAARFYEGRRGSLGATFRMAVPASLKRIGLPFAELPRQPVLPPGVGGIREAPDASAHGQRERGRCLFQTVRKVAEGRKTGVLACHGRQASSLSAQCTAGRRPDCPHSRDGCFPPHVDFSHSLYFVEVPGIDEQANAKWLDDRDCSLGLD